MVAGLCPAAGDNLAAAATHIVLLDETEVGDARVRVGGGRRPGFLPPAEVGGGTVERHPLGRRGADPGARLGGEEMAICRIAG